MIKTWVAATTADEMVRLGIGPIVPTAGELIPAVRTCLNRLLTGNMLK